MSLPTLTFDIGGTKILCALVLNGQILEKKEEKTVKTKTAEDFVIQISKMGKSWAEKTESISIATLGLVHQGSWSAPTLELDDGKNFPLAKKVQDSLEKEVTLVNDAQAAAWGEYCFGAGEGKDMLFVTVSTGVGGGVVFGGRLMQGKTGMAGHIGHIQIDPHGLECTCGRKGCLQTYVSGEGIAFAAQPYYPMAVAKDVFEKASNGESWAKDILNTSASLLTTAISNSKSMFDIEVAVIGGSVGLADGYTDMLNKEMSKEDDLYKVEIKKAVLGKDAGLIGAGSKIFGEFKIDYQ